MEREDVLEGALVAASSAVPELASLLPLVSALQKKRVRGALRLLAAELSDDPESLKERLANDDFVAATVSVTQAVLRTSLTDKAKRLAGLYGNYVEGRVSLSVNEFEELLHTVDLLSDRQFTILTSIFERASKIARPIEETLMDMQSPWRSELVPTLTKLCGVTEATLSAIVRGLGSTGMVNLLNNRNGDLVAAAPTALAGCLFRALANVREFGVPREPGVSQKPFAR